MLGLSTLAVTQPLLDLVGRNATFLVAHGLSGVDVVAFAVVVAFGLPLAGAAIVLAIRSISRRAGDVAHNVLLAAMMTAGILVVLRVGGLGARMHGAAELLLSLAVAVAATWAYSSREGLRQAVNYSAVAAPGVVLLFLLATPAQALLGAEGTGAERIDVGDDAPPIVIAIFDELPLSSLLDQDLQIDRSAYPAFAALAEEATFFRDVTGSHAETFEAIPAILSGRYAETDAVPTAASHPTNIFSLLGDDYRPHALEPLTDLCTRCDDAATTPAASSTATLVRDLFVVQRHLVVPDDLAEGLPPLDVGWRDFGGAEEEVLDRERFRERAATALEQDAADVFAEFTSQIGASSTPTLNVVHTLLPHRPWRYLPDGRQHLGMNDVTAGGQWTSVEWAAAHGLQLHYAQTQFTDKLLGELITVLRTSGVYDETLLVVAADHGMSLVAGTPTRQVTEPTLNDIAAVPLIIKAPGQTAGAVSDAPLETVDILPTILDVLGVDPVKSLDGSSAFDEAAVRPQRRLIDETGREWDIRGSRERVVEAVDHKFDLFGAGGEFDLYSLAPPGHEDLRGQPVPAQLPEAQQLTLVLARQEEYADVDPSSEVLPAAIAGRVEGLDAGSAQPVLAIAVNGVIEAVTLADTEAESPGKFRALVPPEVLREGTNTIDVLYVDDEGHLERIPAAG